MYCNEVGEEHMKAVRVIADISDWTALLLFTQNEGSSDWTCVMSDSLMQELKPLPYDSYDGSDGSDTNALFRESNDGGVESRGVHDASRT